jgi:hypothetical protein
MKKLIFFLIFTVLFAKVNIKDIVGEKTYNEYRGLIQTIEKTNSNDLTKIITLLKENGLIELFFDKPKIIHPKFIFLNNNPEFNTKTLYTTLTQLGYFYFYPSEIKNDTNYSITIEMQSTHHIDPVNFINQISNYGCKVINLKNRGDFIYTIDCQKEFLPVPKIKKDIKAYQNVKGEYWFDTNNFKKISISTSRFDKWHPYIAIYDKHLNLIRLYTSNKIERKIKLTLTNDAKYIKIRDNFTKENIKRGIFVKGLQ